MSVTGWAVLACGCLGLRVFGATLVAAGRAPVWSGLLVEVLLWVGGPAVVDPAALSNPGFWPGLLALVLLWAPAIGLARRGHAARSARGALVVVALCALAAQAAVTQLVVAGTVSEATDGQVCLFPRKIIDIGGDLFPLAWGTSVALCVQGRPGGGYIGDYPGPPP